MERIYGAALIGVATAVLADWPRNFIASICLILAMNLYADSGDGS